MGDDYPPSSFGGQRKPKPWASARAGSSVQQTAWDLAKTVFLVAAGAALLFTACSPYTCCQKALRSSSGAIRARIITSSGRPSSADGDRSAAGDGGSSGLRCSSFFPWCDFPAELEDSRALLGLLDRMPTVSRMLHDSNTTSCGALSMVEYLCTEAALTLGPGDCAWPGYAGHGSPGVLLPGSLPPQPQPQPPLPPATVNTKGANGQGGRGMEFLTPSTCNEAGFVGGLEPETVFFYPVYKLPEMVKLSIEVLQHPKHVFLIQVTHRESTEFVEELRSLASPVEDGDNTNNSGRNVCVVRYGEVVYTTGSQEMIQWPAMEWLLTRLPPTWRHYVLMCGQSLPLLGVRQLRGLLASSPNTTFLRHTRPEADETRRLNRVRIGHAALPFCSAARLRNLTKGRRNGLTRDVADHWHKVGSWPVKVLHRGFVEYLMNDPQAFRAFHFFKYTYISNEHLIPTLLSMAGSDMWSSISEEWSSTLALWPKLKMRNTVLTQAHESYWKGKRILFARKFSPEVDKEVIWRLVHGHSPHIRLPWEQEGQESQQQQQGSNATATTALVAHGAAAADDQQEQLQEDPELLHSIVT